MDHIVIILGGKKSVTVLVIGLEVTNGLFISSPKISLPRAC